MEKPFSPPHLVEPAGKCSPAAAASEQKRAGAAVERVSLLRPFPAAPAQGTCAGRLAKGTVAKGAGGEGERRPREGSLPQSALASLFLGFGQLRGKASSAHVNCCGMLEPGQGYDTPPRSVCKGWSNGNCCS